MVSLRRAGDRGVSVVGHLARAMRTGVRGPRLRSVESAVVRAAQPEMRPAITPSDALAAVGGGIAMGVATQYLFVRERIGLDVLVAVVLCAALALVVKRK